MIPIEDIFYEDIKSIISNWNENGIYAISFFVYANMANSYNGFNNVTDFSISYNTEEDCEGAGLYDEERWNYAFWRQNETPIVDNFNDNNGAKILFQWYKENGIENIGFEDENCYNSKFEYIGKGPVGYYELLSIASNIGKMLQEEGFILNKFGKPIPIIVHGLEYPWYVFEATKRANPNGEAETFLKAMGMNFGDYFSD